jgi:hypothetical protein
MDKDERLSPAEFDLYARGASDFLVFDAEYEPKFVVEFDGFGPDDVRQVTRDRIKNALCARAGLPLLRIGADDLREREETSILEWLCAAYVASERELDEGLKDDADADELIGIEAAEEQDPSDDDDVIGEPGTELNDPFPSGGFLDTRHVDSKEIADAIRLDATKLKRINR